MTAAVFLDRDGVISRADVRDGKPFSVLSPDEMEIIPGVDKAVQGLKGAGFKIIAATNQPDVATGKREKSVVEVMKKLSLYGKDLGDYSLETVKMFFDDAAADYKIDT